MTVIAFAGIMGAIGGLLLILLIFILYRYKKFKNKQFMVHIKSILEKKKRERINIDVQPMTEVSVLKFSKKNPKEATDN